MSEKAKIFLVDLDGTLADNTHRQRFLNKELYSGMSEDDRWEAFFSLCLLDSPKIATIETVKALFKEGHRPIICTGRPERYREASKMWADYHDIPYVGFYMRSDDDRRPDHEVKKDMLEDIYRNSGYTKHDILLVLDDRQSVVDMWRSLGLTCFQVAPGDF